MRSCATNLLRLQHRLGLRQVPRSLGCDQGEGGFSISQSLTERSRCAAQVHRTHRDRWEIKQAAGHEKYGTEQRNPKQGFSAKGD